LKIRASLKTKMKEDREPWDVSQSKVTRGREGEEGDEGPWRAGGSMKVNLSEKNSIYQKGQGGEGTLSKTTREKGRGW